MSRIAVVLADGFEEIEALTPVDVLRRSGFEVDIVGFEAEVAGSHQIVVKADKLLDESLTDYDMIVLPGGLPGATNLRDNAQVIQALQTVAQKGGYVAAICAAPIALAAAGLLKDKVFTSYPGIEAQIEDGQWEDQLVVVDGKVITGRGPAASFDFAYTLVEVLGGDRSGLEAEMQYEKLVTIKRAE